MTDEVSRSRLGRGLAALMGDEIEEVEKGVVRSSPIEFLRPNPKNPRKMFSDAELDDLAHSIQEKGIIQPILVRTISEESDIYEIIAGERRWRASQRVGLTHVPILVIQATEKESLELAIIENVQRTDLNAIEEAQGYQRLIEDFFYSHHDLAKVIGKSRSYVANTLRLLKLPSTTQTLLIEGKISAGHARALLGARVPEELGQRVVSDGLTVRDVERVVQREREGNGGSLSEPMEPSSNREGFRFPSDRDIELSKKLGLEISLHTRSKGGEVRIRYETEEELKRIYTLLHQLV